MEHRWQSILQDAAVVFMALFCCFNWGVYPMYVVYSLFLHIGRGFYDVLCTDVFWIGLFDRDFDCTSIQLIIFLVFICYVRASFATLLLELLLNIAVALDHFLFPLLLRTCSAGCCLQFLVGLEHSCSAFSCWCMQHYIVM